MGRSVTEEPLIQEVWRLGVAACVSMLAAAFGVWGGVEAQMVVWDSAGVRIVSGDGVGSWSAGRGWSLGTAARVIRGDETGSGRDPLFGVVGAARLGSGTIAIANGGYHQLQFHMPDGDSRIVGRAGDGPGEFRQLAWIRQYRGDSVAVYDEQHRRVSVYSEQGTLGREFVVGREMSDLRMQLVSTFSDGRFLVAEGEADARPQEREVVRRGTQLVTYSSDGVRENTVGDVPGSELIVGPFGGASFTGELPFGVKTCIAVSMDTVYVAAQRALAFRKYSEDGGVVARVTAEAELMPLSDGEVERFVDWRMAEYEGSPARGFIAAVLDETPFPAELPARGQLVVDSEGYVWIERFSGEGPGYVVFDAQGELLGLVAVPGDLIIDQVDGKFVVGHRRDELGTEAVELYTLSRSLDASGESHGAARRSGGWISGGWGSRPHCLR